MGGHAGESLVGEVDAVGAARLAPVHDTDGECTLRSLDAHATAARSLTHHIEHRSIHCSQPWQIPLHHTALTSYRIIRLQHVERGLAAFLLLELLLGLWLLRRLLLLRHHALRCEQPSQQGGADSDGRADGGGEQRVHRWMCMR